MNQITDLLKDQSPRVLAALVRLIKRAIAKRRELDEDAIEREIDAVFAETTEAFDDAAARINERFPGG